MTNPLSPAAQSVLNKTAQALEMTNSLSPAAQAVLNAAEPCDELESAIAAALRAAADQVAPETPPSQLGDPEILVGIWGERRIIREDLLTIAAELEHNV